MPRDRLADRARAARHTGQVLQRVVDLAEFDAAATDLDLVVGAPLEQQAGAVERHEITAAVGAVPAESGHGSILLGVLRRIEVAREADTADDEFTGRALLDGVAVGVHDGEIPSVEGQADADRSGAVHQRRAGHDGRLGGSVGVPHLASRNGETFDEIGWQASPPKMSRRTASRLRPATSPRGWAPWRRR